jgi:hypothetical protein
MSPVYDFRTRARVSLGWSGSSLYGFSSQILIAKRAFAVFFIVSSFSQGKFDPAGRGPNRDQRPDHME